MKVFGTKKKLKEKNSIPIQANSAGILLFLTIILVYFNVFDDRKLASFSLFSFCYQFVSNMKIIS